MAARGWLRSILARYAGQAAERLVFTATTHGRPELAEPAGPAPIRFNQSHSHDLTLIAVTRARDIGVDIERLRSSVEPLAIADRFFALGEAAQLRALAPADRVPAFFRCWTCKEAFVKAVGQGLAYPLNQFEVRFAPGEPCRLMRVHNSTDAASRWRLESLVPHPDYAGCLVVAGHDWTLCCWAAEDCVIRDMPNGDV